MICCGGVGHSVEFFNDPLFCWPAGLRKAVDGRGNRVVRQKEAWASEFKNGSAGSKRKSIICKSARLECPYPQLFFLFRFLCTVGALEAVAAGSLAQVTSITDRDLQGRPSFTEKAEQGRREGRTSWAGTW